MTTIYPIKVHHLNQFKAQLAREPNLETYGNYRNTLPETPGHTPVIIKTMSGNTGMLIAIIILALATFALLVLLVAYKRALDEAKVQKEKEAEFSSIGQPSEKENKA